MSVTIDNQQVSAELRKLVAVVDGPRRPALMEVLGKTHEQTLQGHFLRKNRKPNKRGWKKQNFWARIRRATSFAGATADRATIAISDPAFGTHLEGATIRPRRTKYLAIPMREEAYGVRPSSGLIPDLFFAQNKKGTKFLARKGAGGELEVFYFLTRRVTIPRDPTALPPRAESDRALVDSASDFIQRETR